VRLETRNCEDCGLDLPLKQFASYHGKRHPLCRTCLAIDVAEFKEFVLPFVLERRQLGVAYYAPMEPWEWAVMERLELTGAEKLTMTQRSRVTRVRDMRRPDKYGPEVTRPWKHLVGAH